jgi:poly-gamma-glutamate synthesis protein (capsule biosynthesis protein)
MGNPSPCTGCTVFIGDEQNAKGFAEVGFDFLAASGNHMGDGGQSAIKRTVEVLTENNIQFTGIGKGEDEQLKPAIKDINGKRIGMISADDVSYFYWSSDPSVYGVNSFSTAANGVLTINQDKIQKIKVIKEEYDIDYLIVYESWGVEYTNKANAHQAELAHMFIDNGADLVVASHPHWVQNIEFYNGKPIFYALGNFIFDQTHTVPTRQSVVLDLSYYMGDLKSIKVVTLQTCGYHQTTTNLTAKYLNGELTSQQMASIAEKDGCVYWQPRIVPPTDDQYDVIMDRVFEYSSI